VKRYALAGASGRALYMYAKPLVTELGEYADVVGVFDVNTIRANIVSEECGGIPVYDDFNLMLEETRADAVIVTTVDGLLASYVPHWCF
jgi:predicted dehydrogenase